MVSLDSKETIKTFLLLFCIAGIIILSINTYILVQNQSRIINNQETKGIPAVLENMEHIKNLEGNLSAHIQSTQQSH